MAAAAILWQKDNAKETQILTNWQPHNEYTLREREREREREWLHTERKVVVSGGIDTTKSNNFAAKCYNASSVVHVMSYLCSRTKHIICSVTRQHIATSAYRITVHVHLPLHPRLCIRVSWLDSRLGFFLVLFWNRRQPLEKVHPTNCVNHWSKLTSIIRLASSYITGRCC